MIYGEVPTVDAVDMILVHSLRAEGVSFKKGRKLSAHDLGALSAAGIKSVTVVRLEPGDVPEDEASATLAAALAGPGTRVGAPFTGRANFYAEDDGVLIYERSSLDAINLVDEALTVAALPPFETVTARQMIGTVKVIPFAAPGAALDKAMVVAAAQGHLLRVAPFQPHNVGLVATRLPSTKESVLDKGHRVLEARLSAMGSHIGKELRCAHDAAEISVAVATLLAEGYAPVLVFGASAIADRRDVIPAGIIAAGGEVLHFGMPVDPGNLMLLGRHGQTPVLGLPGCARSPALNGFDWVLARLLADVEVTSADVMRMGAGGLLKEISSRPQPREGKVQTKPAAPRIGAVVLAAGKSSRMGDTNKLTTDVDGSPMVVHAVQAAAQSGANPIVVVTGHEAQKVQTALAGTPVTFVHNSDYAEGLSTSLRAGVRALPDTVDAAFICLGDMPDLTADHLARLAAAYDPDEGRTICVPTFGGKRGNPILWGVAYFAELQSMKGDTGAKHLIGEHLEAVCEVPMPDDAPLRDIDTPEDLVTRQMQE